MLILIEVYCLVCVFTKDMPGNWTKEENGGHWPNRNGEEEYHQGGMSRMSTHLSHFQDPRGGALVPAEIRTTNMMNEVSSGNVILRPNNIDVQQNNDLKMQLDRANQTIEDLKKMLVKSYSDSKRGI